MSYRLVRLAFIAGYTHSLALRSLLVDRTQLPELPTLARDWNALARSCYAFLERLSL